MDTSTRFNSISAELLGPEIKLMQEGIFSPFFTFSRKILAAWVILGTIATFGYNHDGIDW